MQVLFSEGIEFKTKEEYKNFLNILQNCKKLQDPEKYKKFIELVNKLQGPSDGYIFKFPDNNIGGIVRREIVNAFIKGIVAQKEFEKGTKQIVEAKTEVIEKVKTFQEQVKVYQETQQVELGKTVIVPKGENDEVNDEVNDKANDIDFNKTIKALFLGNVEEQAGQEAKEVTLEQLTYVDINDFKQITLSDVEEMIKTSAGKAFNINQERAMAQTKPEYYRELIAGRLVGELNDLIKTNEGYIAAFQNDEIKSRLMNLVFDNKKYIQLFDKMFELKIQLEIQASIKDTKKGEEVNKVNKLNTEIDNIKNEIKQTEEEEQQTEWVKGDLNIILALNDFEKGLFGENQKYTQDYSNVSSDCSKNGNISSYDSNSYGSGVDDSYNCGPSHTVDSMNESLVSANKDEILTSSQNTIITNQQEIEMK